MPRGADRLLGKFTSSIESAPDGRRRSWVRRQPSNAVYIFRHPIGKAQDLFMAFLVNQWLYLKRVDKYSICPGSGTASADDALWSGSLTRELENATGSRLRPVGSIIRRSPMSVRQQKLQGRPDASMSVSWRQAFLLCG